MQMQAEHRTLTTQHESLVSEYHQLFVSFPKQDDFLQVLSG